MLLVCCQYVGGLLVCYWCVVCMLVSCRCIIGVTRNLKNGLWAFGIFKMIARTRCGLFSVSYRPQHVLANNECIKEAHNAQNVFWHYFSISTRSGYFFRSMSVFGVCAEHR